MAEWLLLRGEIYPVNARFQVHVSSLQVKSGRSLPHLAADFVHLNCLHISPNIYLAPFILH